jgi:hypothetical protein
MNASTAAGYGLNAAWGFAEGTLFFVVPDVAFTRTTLTSPRRGLLQLGAAVLGALVAGAVIYAWAASRPAEARAVVAAVPFVGEKIVTPAERRWNERGVSSLFKNPLNGVPYKVYAVLAPPRLPAASFLLLSVPMRVERMILSWIVFAAAGRWIARLPASRQRRTAILFHAGFWVLVYVVYWTANA